MESKTMNFFIYFILSLVFIVCIIWLDNQNISLLYTNITLATIIVFLALISYLLYKTNINAKLVLSNNDKSIKINNKLKKRIKRAISELRVKNEKINRQSRAAAMGEMIDAIAHQWKSPLSITKLYILDIIENLENGENISKAQLEVQLKKCIHQIDHINTTLDEFRSFFRPKEIKTNISLIEIINSTLLLLKDELIRNNIEVNIINLIDENPIVNVIPNEFKHVLINLINNSKDAFIENNIDDRLINLKISYKNKKISLRVCDNAGGIPTDIIHRIFESNFTTKSKSEGTGIGLYMSKQILNKNEVKIDVYNTNDGACFEMIFINFSN